MSNILAGIRTHLAANAGVAAIVGTRIYAVRAPQRATLPFIVINRLSEEQNNTLDNEPAESGQLFFADCDIDCKAATIVGASTLSSAVRSALADYTGDMGDQTCEAVIITDRSNSFEQPEFADDVGRDVETIDFTIQYRPV